MCFITFFFFSPLFPSFHEVLLQIFPCFSSWKKLARIYIPEFWDLLGCTPLYVGHPHLTGQKFDNSPLKESYVFVPILPAKNKRKNGLKIHKFSPHKINNFMRLLEAQGGPYSLPDRDM